MLGDEAEQRREPGFDPLLPALAGRLAGASTDRALRLAQVDVEGGEEELLLAVEVVVERFAGDAGRRTMSAILVAS